MTTLRQFFCSHRISLDKLRRVSPERVECPCNRCGKVLTARWEAAPPLAEWPVP